MFLLMEDVYEIEQSDCTSQKDVISWPVNVFVNGRRLWNRTVRLYFTKRSLYGQQLKSNIAVIILTEWLVNSINGHLISTSIDIYIN